MQMKKMTYRKTVLQLLKIKGAKSNLINQYDKGLEDEISELFTAIASLIK